MTKENFNENSIDIICVVICHTVKTNSDVRYSVMWSNVGELLDRLNYGV